MPRHPASSCSRAFTIVELLVVVSIIGLLVGILLPAVTSAKKKAQLTASQSNLRQLGVAHANYASNWNGRQFTLAVDNMSDYGPTPVEAVQGYIDKHRLMVNGELRDTGWPPGIELGWGENNNDRFLWVAEIEPANHKRNYALLEPIAFKGAWGDPQFDIARFGYFRMPNARQFSQYLGGRFFDGVFYAPKDEVVMDLREGAADSPYEYPDVSILRDNYDWSDNDFCYSSYSLSPAALFSPDVMRNTDDGGWQNPWDLPAGFRAPGLSQARYPELKTHMLEHHWLQSPPQVCNPAVTEPSLRPYRNCQPFFFNQGWESTPATVFYDGHVELIGIRASERADGLHRKQAGYGLWSRDTPFGEDGYWIDRGYDQAASSVHILTTDGILGRDKMSGG